MPQRRTVLLGLAALAALGTGASSLTYRRDLAKAQARIAPELSTLIETQQGFLEYAEAGDGPPILFLHGTGGGFDQGLHFGQRLVSLGYRIVAPSRFGYLRSAIPADPGPFAQAEALADLLDHLGLGEIAVAGGSAGAIPAMAFAIRYPERTKALLPIVPAAYVPGRPLPEPWSPAVAGLAEMALGSDLLFWASIKALPDTMMGALLATDPALVHAAAPEEQSRAWDILRFLLPMSARRPGLLNDAAETGRAIRLDYTGISAPTLAISLEDDRFGTAANARHIAKAVTGARLLIYPDGGHIWVGRDAELFGDVDGFLRELGYG